MARPVQVSDPVPPPTRCPSGPHGVAILEQMIDEALTHITENETKILVNLVASMPRRFEDVRKAKGGHTNW